MVDGRKAAVNRRMDFVGGRSAGVWREKGPAGCSLRGTGGILTRQTMSSPNGAQRYAPFTSRAITVIRAIPAGKVATYGQIAALAGSPGGARQIVRILHSLSAREGLPWHRVINSRGEIALPEGGGREAQRAALKTEGVRIDARGRIDMTRCQWWPAYKDTTLE